MAQDVKQVEETLATIRRLMERGERYEAVTGRGALIAGIAALAMAMLVHRLWSLPSLEGRQGEVFVAAWAALAVVAAGWIIRSALRIPSESAAVAGERFSPAARAVGRAVLPAYVAALGITLGWLDWQTLYLPGAWMCLHGVAILATGHHAPRRLVALGWAFLALGVSTSAVTGVSAAVSDTGVSLGYNAAMALGFGGLNIAYGLFSLLRPLPSED